MRYHLVSIPPEGLQDGIDAVLANFQGHLRHIDAAAAEYPEIKGKSLVFGYLAGQSAARHKK